MMIALGPGLQLVLNARKARAHEQLGQPTITLRPQRAMPGDEVELVVQIEPGGDMTLKQASARLVCEEVATETEKTDTPTTHRHLVHEESRPLIEAP